MLLNFHRIPASGEYTRKANKRRTRIADFHTFAEPLSATLWKILWIERNHPPSRRPGRRVNFFANHAPLFPAKVAGPGLPVRFAPFGHISPAHGEIGGGWSFMRQP